MPPAAVGALFANIGMAAAVEAVVATVYTTAVVGAVVGAASAAIQGGNILKGALMGAVSGGIAGGLGKGLSLAMGVGKAGVDAVTAKAEPTTLGNVSSDSQYVDSLLSKEMSPASSSASPTTSVNDIANSLKVEAAGGGDADGGESGVLGGLTKWMNKNPKSADIIAQGLGGAASGMLESKSEKERLEYLMERDRLDRQPRVTGLDKLNTGGSAIPSISGFTKRPSWLADEDNGLLPVRVGG